MKCLILWNACMVHLRINPRRDMTSLCFWAFSRHETARSDFETSEIEIWQRQVLTQASGRAHCIEAWARNLQCSKFSNAISWNIIDIYYFAAVHAQSVMEPYSKAIVRRKLTWRSFRVRRIRWTCSNFKLTNSCQHYWHDFISSSTWFGCNDRFFYLRDVCASLFWEERWCVRWSTCTSFNAPRCASIVEYALWSPHEVNFQKEIKRLKNKRALAVFLSNWF